MPPLISVIVPVYKVECYLKNCLESILSQTYQNIELILINDGATDGSSEICTTWMNKDTRIKYYYQENSGVSAARNLGMENACGQYIAFVDSDDFVEKYFCENGGASFCAGAFGVLRQTGQRPIHTVLCAGNDCGADHCGTDHGACGTDHGAGG